MDSETIAASVAGAVGADLVFYPLDTVITLQQTSTNFSYVLPLRRYYQGFTASVALTAPAFTVYLASYRQCKQQLTPYFGEKSFINYIISGGVAEFASSSIWTPLEVIKGRMQILNSSSSTWQLMGHIYRNEGFKGFYRGYWMGIAVFLPSSVVWWASYEHFKDYASEWKRQRQGLSERPDLSTLEYGLASGLATISSVSATNFLDVVKTRQQLAAADEITSMRPDDYRGVWNVGRNLVKEVGLWRALVKGLHVRLLHSLPTGIVSMAIVETISPDRGYKGLGDTQLMSE
uniref:ARAD1B10318p n=1 Tax=Blastobotrys adeninivorans TaxID=409370 RepID=A0A060T6A7_BLAAD